MKLTTALIAAVAADEERAFADNETWMNAYETWWNPNISVKYFENIKDSLPAFQAAFDANAPNRIANTFKRDMKKLVKNLENAKRRCDAASSNRRRRRSDDKGNRTLYPFDNMNQDILKVWGLFAKYTRNEFWNCEANVDVFKFYKRIDRFRWIYLRHYCTYVDGSEAHCDWATTAMNGEKFDKPFRQMSWFTNKYGIDAANPFAPDCPLGFVEMDIPSQGKKCVEVNKGKYKINTAFAHCNKNSATMAMPQNGADNRFFADLIGYNKYDLWIPASDAGTEGIFLNMNDNSALTYTNWNKGEPNNVYWDGGEENYVHMILTHGNGYEHGYNGKWNDIPSHNHADDPDRIAYNRNNAFICVKDLNNAPPPPPPRCSGGFIEMDIPSQGRKCVEVKKGKYQIRSAFAHCNKNSATMAMPQSDADNRFLADLIGYNKYDLWIPASDSGTEGTFLNMNDNSALTYTNWNKNEPNNIYWDGGEENYVHMILTHGNSYGRGSYNGKWNDVPSHNQDDEPDRIAYNQNNAFICVKDLE